MPPEIIELLPLDGLLDTIQMQQSSSPVATPTPVEEAAASLDALKPSDVVLGKTSQDGMGIHARRNAALHATFGNNERIRARLSIILSIY